MRRRPEDWTDFELPLRNASDNLDGLIQERTAQISARLKALQSTLTTGLADLDNRTQDLSNRLAEYRLLLEGPPRSELEEALLDLTPDTIVAFISSNELTQFITPEKREKPAVLLNLIIFLMHVLDNAQALEWTEAALLEFDTQDREIKRFAPDVFRKLQVRIRGVPGKTAHSIAHLVRSLLLDFDK
jgi:hypothetical protein